MDPDFAAALLALLQAAMKNGGRKPLFVEIIFDDQSVARFPVPIVAQNGAPPTGGDGPRPGRLSLRGLILDALRQAEAPLSQAGLARKCGRRNSGHFRETLESMIQGGEVRRLPTGHYWLPGRNLPGGWRG